MEWDKSLEIGIPIIDEQHQSLFRQVSDLLDRSKAERVWETLKFLGEYVHVHFGTEEAIQQTCRYPDAASHKKMHEAFVETFEELKAEYESTGGGMLILMEITKVALDWLKYHIKGADKAFAEYFRISTKMSDLVDSRDDSGNALKDSAHAPGLHRVIRGTSTHFKKDR